MNNLEDSFPRGRSSVEKKSIKQKKRKQKDFLFAQETHTVHQKKKPKTSLLPLGGGHVVTQKKNYLIESLSFSKLAKGTKLLGRVRFVAESHAVISLPNMLSGYVLQQQQDEDLKNVLQPNQVLAVVVTKTATESLKDNKTRRRIQVSVAPQALNNVDSFFEFAQVRGQIHSVEDHGCLINLGHGKRGFLKFENIKVPYSFDVTQDKLFLTKGRILDVFVMPGEQAVLPLQISSENQISPEPATPSLNSLAPNTLVRARVEGVARNGLLVQFWNGLFRGAMESGHLEGRFKRGKKKSLVHEWNAGKHKSVLARIICVDAKTKVIRLSTQSHLVQERSSPPPMPKLGRTIENASVVRLDAGVGALLAWKLDESDDGSDNDISTDENDDDDDDDDDDDSTETVNDSIRTAYVHISKASDDKMVQSDFTKHFAVGSLHKIRIIATNCVLEGIATAATAPSIVEAHVLTHDDLKPAQVYRNVPITALVGKAFLLNLGSGVSGLVPPQHVMDTFEESKFRAKVIKTKFAVGNKIHVKVLTVDPTTKKSVLTAKPSLVNDSHPPITAYKDLKKKQVATGFITKVDSAALFVTFYNNVFGRVTAKRMAEEQGIENVFDNYKVGQVVTCRVVNCEEPKPNYWHLELSLSLHGSLAPIQEQEVRLISGTVFPAKTMKIVQLVPSKKRGDGVLPGYAVVAVKHNVASVECKIPFDQLADAYDANQTLDAVAFSLLTVGKKINQPGIVLQHPPARGSKQSLPVVSLRRKFIRTATKREPSIVLPSSHSQLVVGAQVQGFVVRADDRHGVFVRFLDNVTGLIPKLRRRLPLYSTVSCKILALDASSNPPKILLKLGKHSKKSLIHVGDVLKQAKVLNVNFARALVELLDDKFTQSESRVVARVHVTMGESSSFFPQKKRTDNATHRITKIHPFYKWHEGMMLEGLKCSSVRVRRHTTFVELTNRAAKKATKDMAMSPPPLVCVRKLSDLRRKTKTVSVIVTFVPKSNRGVWVQICPLISGFIPALELSKDVKVLNSLRSYFPVGARVDCCIMNQEAFDKAKRRKSMPKDSDKKKNIDRQNVFLSHLLYEELSEDKTMETAKELSKIIQPNHGELVIGRINRSVRAINAPALMVDLRGGFLGRCCVTELEEMDEWSNMPLGRQVRAANTSRKDADNPGNVVTDDEVQNRGSEDDASTDAEEDRGYETSASEDPQQSQQGLYPDGKYVECRVLKCARGSPFAEVSLRSSRIDGDLDDDELPEVKDFAHAYVVDTNKKGCFVRLSRQVEGRTTLKEIADGFIPDPAASFPMGRLVAGKVKTIKERKQKKRKDLVRAIVDFDLRESTLLASKEKLQLEDVEVGRKYKGVVTRIESYGVFVRLDNSNVSGLVHKSECSDDYVKSVESLYDPGDLVKVLVVKADQEQKRIGLSMKASHFDDDDNSDESSVDSSFDTDTESEIEEDIPGKVLRDSGDELNSDDEHFAAKLAAKMNPDDNDDEGSTGANSESGDDSEGSSEADDESSVDDSDDENDGVSAEAMDTDVGFNWEAGASSLRENPRDDDSDDGSSSGEESDDDEGAGGRKSHKSRKKAATRRREEQEISRRETALADGTADENPETRADFERLLASEPNSSEHWIRYMAYHLSIADVQSARGVAERAFNRIEFRREGEKLNVWTALLTLELKYGSPAALQDTIDRACQHNNPKQVYLRVCEMLEKEIESTDSPSVESRTRVDEMFTKMCKKFRSKKTVWIAHLQYLLRSGRHQEAHSVMKRSLTSLPEYKHVEIMSKFAQLEFEHGSAERGRTLFDGLLEKYPKRLDLLFVYVDKEVKAGDNDAARSIFEKVLNADNRKLSDKQMKSLFKKWYRLEEVHGNEERREHVKDAARAYVEQTTKA